MRIHNDDRLKFNRKKLRNKGTSAEAVLWTYLSQSKLDGRKFRRQHSINNYIVNFFCYEEKLAVELDGNDHFWQKGMSYDQTRDKSLQQSGIRIIRFENKWVFEDPDYVLKEIQKMFKQ